MIRIRPARPGDEAALSRLLIRSILELCAADHKGDPEIIARWIANKTPESVARWIVDSRFPLFVAERGGEPAGAGAFGRDGHIVLNYVDPAHRLQGVSRAMLAHMEAELAQAGLRKATLSSTETAHRFYLGAGWRDAGPVEMAFGMPGYPMRKALAPASPAGRA